jgi:predicted component of type VI protein secretion system
MKILYNTQTAQLVSYNRSDDEPPVGLEPHYIVLDLVQGEQPDHNPATHSLRRTETIDTDNLQCLRGWELVAHEPMPVIVSMTALRLTLIEMELEDDVLSIINAMPHAKQKAAALAWWQTAQAVRRNHPLVAQLAAALGKTDAEIDAIFAAAITLSATL